VARIRTIKPDFWTNEKILSVKPLTRLLFIGMWNFADDFGRMQFAPLGIKAKVFPNDEMSAADVRDMLNELCSADLLMIYSANDKEYIEITGWDHQKIDKRQASKIPAPFADGSVIRGIPPTSADFPQTSPTPAPVMEGNGMEGKVVEGEKETREAALSFGPQEFVSFWAEWPNKVGKPAAVKALASARKRGVPFETIMDGVRRYVRTKPPDRAWMNPATFLNGNRWEDEPAAVARLGSAHQQERETGREILNALRDASSRTDSEFLRHDTGNGPESIRGGVRGALIDLSSARDRAGNEPVEGAGFFGELSQPRKVPGAS
jgi:hypothetical protein